jgi:hypothetical protein
MSSCVPVDSTLWRNCGDYWETGHSTMRISVISTQFLDGSHTPTFERPRNTTSGPSATGSCENLPTVKRRIGVGLKKCWERCSRSTDTCGVRGLMLSDVANEGPRRLMTSKSEFSASNFQLLVDKKVAGGSGIGNLPSSAPPRTQSRYLVWRPICSFPAIHAVISAKNV